MAPSEPWPEPWPAGSSRTSGGSDSCTAASDASAVVQQELSNLKALKRLSIGSTMSPLDPDLPQPIPSDSGPMPGSDTRFKRRSGSSGSPDLSSPLQSQYSHHGDHPHQHMAREPQSPAQPSKSTDPAELEKLLWVPAHVHPEIAPNEWKSFVQEKLAEISAKNQQQHELAKDASKSPPSPPSSRLSHMVTDQTQYMDASELLDRRRRRSQGTDPSHRRSILELSAQIQQLGELESLATSPVDDRPMAPPPGTPPGSPSLGGATGLRRTTHSTRRERPRISRPPSREPSLVRRASTKVRDGDKAGAIPLTPNHPGEKPSRLEHENQPDSEARPGMSPSTHPRLWPEAKLEPDSTPPKHDGEAEETTSVSPDQQHHPNSPLKINTAVATTAPQLPSPSAAAPPPGGSVLLGYRRKHLHSRDASYASQASTSSNSSPESSPDSPRSAPASAHSQFSTIGPTNEPEGSLEPSPSNVDSVRDAPQTSKSIEPEEEKSQKRWRWLDGSSSKEFAKIFKSKKDKRAKDSQKDLQKDTRKDSQKDPKKDLQKDVEKSPSKDPAKSTSPVKSRRGHARTDSRTSNIASHEAEDGEEQYDHEPQRYIEGPRRSTEEQHRSPEADQNLAQSQAALPSNNQDEEIQLPYDIPAHQISDRSYIMMYHRFPLHIERAIYRLSHMKLANPRRPLRQQVLLSNFMYAYLNLINQGYQQQQMQQRQQQQQQQNQQLTMVGMEQLEAEQLAQLQAIEYQNNMAMYQGSEDETSSSSSDEGDDDADAEASNEVWRPM